MNSWESESGRHSRRPAASGHDRPVSGEVGNPEPDNSFATDRLAEDWSFGAPVRPGESVSGTIDRFSPRNVPQRHWSRVAPVVKESVAKVQHTDAVLARKCLSIVGQLALWADRIGLPVDAASLFTPELIDRFITEGCVHLAKGTQLNYRSQLWRVGAAVVGHKLFPPRPAPLHASDPMAPYSAAQVTELISWSRGLPTASMRRNTGALLFLGLGTGMKTEEITRTVGTDIREEDGIVLVDVTGSGGRIDRVVPVHQPYADHVLTLARESGERPFFGPDRTAIHRGDVLGFIKRCSIEGPGKFTVQRLRVTWLVGHLAAGTHLYALQGASGVAVAQLVKYLRFVEPLDEADAHRMLARRP
jgi:hypothetical protein